MGGNVSVMSASGQEVQAQKIDLNKIGGIRGDYLLNIEKSNFTTRAVQYAIQRAS